MHTGGGRNSWQGPVNGPDASVLATHAASDHRTRTAALLTLRRVRRSACGRVIPSRSREHSCPRATTCSQQRSVMRKAMDCPGCGHAKPSVLLGIMVMVPLLSTVVGTPFCIFTPRARAFHPTHLLLTPSWAHAARVLQDSLLCPSCTRSTRAHRRLRPRQ